MSVSKMCSAFTAGFVAIVALMFAAADEQTASDRPSADAAGTTAPREIAVEVLKPLGTVVGEWKGVAQPKRGSNAGAWSEKAQAAWKFDEKSAALVVNFEPGQQFRTFAFSVADDEKTAQLTLARQQGDAVNGKVAMADVIELVRTAAKSAEADDKTWIFESPADQTPQTRCTLRIISDIRMTVLFEEKPTEKSAYRRLSEIGLTRMGAKLADGNSGERQCVVTGGLGTIKVSHEGKTYYVCCEGCKQAFDADPAGTLDAYRERLKKPAAK